VAVRKQAIYASYQYGFNTEIEHFGLGIDKGIGTAMFSYGDLAANAAGLRFWLNLSDMFQCTAGRGWTAIKPFRWADYVTPAWDESINPNEYKTKAIAEKVQNQLNRLYARRKNPSFVLPMDPRLCESLNGRLPSDFEAEMVLHPKCLELYHRGKSTQ
jgi:hypothetical protein